MAKDIGVPPRRINEIVLEKRGITADTALRLARYFGTSAELWTGLQADYDLRALILRWVRLVFTASPSIFQRRRVCVGWCRT